MKQKSLKKAAKYYKTSPYYTLDNMPREMEEKKLLRKPPYAAPAINSIVKGNTLLFGSSDSPQPRKNNSTV